jgi:hypothetical protein
MGVIKKAFDSATAINFLRKLVYPSNGNSYMDRIIRNIHSLIGNSRLASVASAMFLMREDIDTLDKEGLLEEKIKEYYAKVLNIKFNMLMEADDEYFKHKAIMHKGKLYTRLSFPEFDRRTPSLIHHGDITDALARHLKKYTSSDYRNDGSKIDGHPVTQGFIGLNKRFYPVGDGRIMTANKTRSMLQKFHCDEDIDAAAMTNYDSSPGSNPLTTPKVNKVSKDKKKLKNILTKGHIVYKEDAVAGAPTNNVGNVAGIGTGSASQKEPGVKKRQMDRYRAANKREENKIIKGLGPIMSSILKRKPI